MNPDTQLKKWRVFRRQSIYGLLIGVPFYVATGMVLWIVKHWIAVPTWILLIVAAVGIFMIVGDTVNVLLLGQRIRRAERTSADTRPTRES